jgi:transcriptional regulator with XRE-family HTH domain
MVNTWYPLSVRSQPHREELEIGQLLRAARARRGESLRGVANHLGVSPSYLSRVEGGAKQPSSSFRAAVAQYYGLTNDDVLLAVGQVPPDVVEILRRRPDLLAEIRRRGRVE